MAINMSLPKTSRKGLEAPANEATLDFEFAGNVDPGLWFTADNMKDTPSGIKKKGGELFKIVSPPPLLF